MWLSFFGVDLGHILVNMGLFHRDALIERNQLARSKVQDCCLCKLNTAPCQFLLVISSATKVENFFHRHNLSHVLLCKIE